MGYLPDCAARRRPVRLACARPTVSADRKPRRPRGQEESDGPGPDRRTGTAEEFRARLSDQRVHRAVGARDGGGRAGLHGRPLAGDGRAGLDGSDHRGGVRRHGDDAAGPLRAAGGVRARAGARALHRHGADGRLRRGDRQRRAEAGSLPQSRGRRSGDDLRADRAERALRLRGHRDDLRGRRRRLRDQRDEAVHPRRACGGHDSGGGAAGRLVGR